MSLLKRKLIIIFSSNNNKQIQNVAVHWEICTQVKHLSCLVSFHSLPLIWLCFINLPSGSPPLVPAFLLLHYFLFSSLILHMPSSTWSSHFNLLYFLLSTRVWTYLWALCRQGDRLHSSLAGNHWQMYQRVHSRIETVPDETCRNDNH